MDYIFNSHKSYSGGCHVIMRLITPNKTHNKTEFQIFRKNVVFLSLIFFHLISNYASASTIYRHDDYNVTRITWDNHVKYIDESVGLTVVLFGKTWCPHTKAAVKE